MQKNPIEQLDNLISHEEWPEARKLLLALSPLQATHAVLAAIHWADCVASPEEWKLFRHYLSGRYPPEQIPAWCQMPEEEHQCAGGCWGILHGEVAQKGREHCLSCEYNCDPA